MGVKVGRQQARKRERELLEGIGDFEVLERLGAGVMGAVWRAVDRKLGRPVAIKLLLPHKRGTRAQSRMIREARALARLVHPNVVAVYEVGLIEDEDPSRAPVYIVLEFVAGQTMDEWMVERRGRRRPGGWRAVVSMYRGAGEGLAAAHRAGLIHRDFKPANLLIDRGTGAVKVADFGLAAVGGAPEFVDSTLGDGVDEEGSISGLDHSRDHARLTRMGAVLGTPAYMAPEQLLGEPATAASDQFAFCLCLWEAVHGDRPWRYGSLEELRSAAARRSLSPGRPLERVPRWLDRALRRGLALEPEDRFPNMEALLRELDEGPRRPRRRWTAVALGASLAVVAGASSWWTAERAERTPNAPDLGACEAARSHLAESWNPARAQALIGAFEALGGASARPEAEAVSGFVDARVAVWAEEYAGLCARAAKAPLSETDRRVGACLELRGAELDASLGVLFSGGEGVVEDSVSLVHETLALGPCTDSSLLPLLPEDPEKRARFIELRARVAQLAVLRGKVNADELAGLRAEVELFDHPPLTAAYELVEARYREVQGDEEAFERGLIRAYEAAALGGHEPLALDALGRLLFFMAKQRRFDETEWVERQGLILDARCGAANPRESGTWNNGRALLAFFTGEQETAAEVWRQAWEGYADVPGGEMLGLGMLGNYATAVRHLGRGGEARGLYLRVVELERELYGEDDERLFPPYLGLALLEGERDTEAALAWLGEAQAVAEANMPSQRALALANRADIELGRGAYGRAREAALAATEAYSAIDKRGEQAWVSAGLYQVEAAAMLGELSAARARFEQTRAEAEATYDGDLPYPQLFALLEAMLALEAGELDAAEAALERGRAMDLEGADNLSRGGRYRLLSAQLARRRGQLAEAEAHARAGLDKGGSVTVNVHILQPRLQLLLAEVLWAQGEASPSAEREGEARALVEEARDQLQLAAPTPGRAALLAEVEAWLDAHG